MLPVTEHSIHLSSILPISDWVLWLWFFVFGFRIYLACLPVGRDFLNLGFRILRKYLLYFLMSFLLGGFNRWGDDFEDEGAVFFGGGEHLLDFTTARTQAMAE
ncbi:MAG: hypothetical protein UW94_C0001G0076 [Parcubacteria group bacterium GW2011_GWA2_45_14]|nr:MAG: hypothetical protein UW94_C0001G0076 [Parcubacteria group bacterium GW2011_GWA2_45_14]